jgi:ABC-2 type transport system permease protein
MPVRWAASPVPLDEVALSVAILLATVVGITWVAGRIYRVGILAYGKKPGLKELVRWVRG